MAWTVVGGFVPCPTNDCLTYVFSFNPLQLALLQNDRTSSDWVIEERLPQYHQLTVLSLHAVCFPSVRRLSLPVRRSGGSSSFSSVSSLRPNRKSPPPTKQHVRPEKDSSAWNCEKDTTRQEYNWTLYGSVILDDPHGEEPRKREAAWITAGINFS